MSKTKYRKKKAREPGVYPLFTRESRAAVFLYKYTSLVHQNNHFIYYSKHTELFATQTENIYDSRKSRVNMDSQTQSTMN